MPVAALSGSDWDEAVRTTGPPLLAGFWAEWCVPSHLLASALEAVAGSHGSPLRVGLVDADREPALAERNRLQGLPTVILIQGGREVLRRVGLLTRAELLKLVDLHQ